MATAKISQASLNSVDSTRIALQAQQYAAAEAAVLRVTDYNSLSAHGREDIDNSNFDSEVGLSNETSLPNNIKQRIATISVYKDNEAIPRYTLRVPLHNKAEVGGCQIATGTNGVTITANGNYKNVTVIASSTFSPVDGSWTGTATFNISAGSAKSSLTNKTTTSKGGSKGHYWGTTENVVNQKTISANISQGDIVRVSLGSSSRHSSSTVTVILGS